MELDRSAVVTGMAYTGFEIFLTEVGCKFAGIPDLASVAPLLLISEVLAFLSDFNRVDFLIMSTSSENCLMFLLEGVSLSLGIRCSVIFELRNFFQDSIE